MAVWSHSENITAVLVYVSTSILYERYTIFQRGSLTRYILVSYGQNRNYTGTGV